MLLGSAMLKTCQAINATVARSYGLIDIVMGTARDRSDLKMSRILERISRRSLQPYPLDRLRGENESKLLRCTPRFDAARCLLGLSP